MTDDVFDYQLTKAGKVLIYWQGRLVVTLAGNRARKFAAEIEGADEAAAQLLMARYTGNFKRGNERDGKKRK